MQEVRWVELPKIGGIQNGFLTFTNAEEKPPSSPYGLGRPNPWSSLPLEVERVFWLHGLQPGMVRGRHANRTSHQAFFCLTGAATIRTNFGDGMADQTWRLTEPHKGLYVSPLVWRTIEELFPETVLLVLASEPYREDDYIREYGEFLQEVSKWKHPG